MDTRTALLGAHADMARLMQEVASRYEGQSMPYFHPLEDADRLLTQFTKEVRIRIGDTLPEEAPENELRQEEESLLRRFNSAIEVATYDLEKPD
ncbi:MAG: hypothetical protein JWL80_667 [Parcubacteria group bacterium]|nr:hypothetical protein [Parcubacteria group bacterium]